MPHALTAVVAGVLAIGALVGCGGDDPAAGSGESQISISVAALDYPEFASARYRIETFFRDDDGQMKPVLDVPDFLANGPRGALTYIAPCIAAKGAPRLGQVRIRILEILDFDDQPIDSLRLPPPQVQQFLCAEERDTEVAFKFTVVRPSNTGFTDLTVDIDKIYCAAKIDCQPDLWPDDETGVMGPAIVFGLTCTGGEDVALGDNLLSFSFDSDPLAGCPGLTLPPATYTGYTTFGNQAFWNTILPLTGADTGAPCTLHATGLLYDRREDGARPPIFQTGGPFIDYEVTVSGLAICDGVGPPRVEAIYAPLTAIHAFDGDAPATADAPVRFNTLELRPATLPGGLLGHEVRTLTTSFPGVELMTLTTSISSAWSFAVTSAGTPVATEFLTACAVGTEGSAWKELYLVVTTAGGSAPIGAVRLTYDAATSAWTCAGAPLPDGTASCPLAFDEDHAGDVPCFAGFVSTGDGAFQPGPGVP